MNKQEVGTGSTDFDTRFNIYKITSTDAINGYFSSVVLPALPFHCIIDFECDVRLGSATAGLVELHTHSSPYYGSVFEVVDQQKITSTEWSRVKLRYMNFGKANTIYPRLNLGADDSAGTIEFRNMVLRLDTDGDITLNGLDRELRSKKFGPLFQLTQGFTSTTTGSGVIDDTTSANYTEFTATGTDTAFITIDDFAGFERNLNTEYYVLEIDALVEIQTEECIARFAFRDSVGGDVFYDCKLTQTIENAVASTGNYQTYRFWIVQDGSPSTIDSVELELGAMVDFPSSCRVREIRLRSYGLTTSNLKQTELHACCTVEKQVNIWNFDDDYRRENFQVVTEKNANTLDISIAYVTGKLMVPIVGMRNNGSIHPVISNVNAQGVEVQFYDTSDTIMLLSAVPDTSGFYLKGES